MSQVAVQVNQAEVVDNGRDDEFKEFIGDDDEDIDKTEVNGVVTNSANKGGVAAGLFGNGSTSRGRAKRFGKFILTRTHSDSSVSAPLRALKNSRKSRNGFGRGLPKKGGAGGKGTWGKPGSEVLEEVAVFSGALDPNDPNYDDAEDMLLKATDSKADARPPPDLTDEELCKQLHSCVLEYFSHGDTEEAYSSVEELSWREDQRYLLVVTAVETAIDHKPSHCEMTSVLLADLYNYSLREHHYAQGFDKLIRNIDDLVIDVPEAPTFLGNFIARCIADDCIPPKFLSSYRGQLESDNAARALSRAQSLYHSSHGLVRLDAVWGVGGGMRPVKLLVKKMSLLLQEYLSSCDVEEAQRCLVELEVPHFHHELVYEAVVMALEKMDDRNSSLIIKLLSALRASVVVTPNQMQEGFLRVYEDMPQICLDVPPAHTILENFVKKCLACSVISETLARKMPTRGRKRFVSEGDGGRFKDSFL